MSENKNQQEEILKNYVEETESVVSKDQIGPAITPVPEDNLPWIKKEHSLGNQLGWIPLSINDLPTRGLFYPPGTTAAIRAASAAEIRHWSTLQEDDLAVLDDMLNYILERCVTIKSSDPDHSFMNWKDIKEIDRFYFILAVHELTFIKGENKLQVNVSETKLIDVKKDMINYITLDPKLMQYYDEKERCFVFKIKDGQTIRVDLPSTGVTQWLKNYVIQKHNNREPFDEDYLTFAPFTIRGWRGLTEEVYNRYIEDSHKWSVAAISLLAHVKQIFLDTINPVIRFKDEGGTEQTAPLNFRGGIKSIFLISDPFGELE